MPVLPCNVPSHGVVPSKGSVAEGTRDSDSLVSLSDVSTKVGFITVCSLAERAFKFCSWKMAFEVFMQLTDKSSHLIQK